MMGQLQSDRQNTMPDLEQVRREIGKPLYVPGSQFEGTRSHGTANTCKPSRLKTKEEVLRCIARGMTWQQTAELVGYHHHTIRQWFREPEMMAALKELNAMKFAEVDAELQQSARNLTQRMDAAADEALDRVIDLMRNADSEMVQLRAGQDLMDRRPQTSKIHRVDKRVAHVNIDQKWLEAAAQVEAEEGKVING